MTCCKKKKKKLKINPKPSREWGMKKKKGVGRRQRPVLALSAAGRECGHAGGGGMDPVPPRGWGHHAPTLRDTPKPRAAANRGVSTPDRAPQRQVASLLHPRLRAPHPERLRISPEDPQTAPTRGTAASRDGKPRRGQFEAGTAAAKPRAGAGTQPKKERFGHRSQSSCRGEGGRRPWDARRNAKHPTAQARPSRAGMKAGGGSIPSLPWDFKTPRAQAGPPYLRIRVTFAL